MAFHLTRFIPTLALLLAFGLSNAEPAAGVSGRENERRYIETLKAWVERPGDDSASRLQELEAAATGSKLSWLDEAEERIVNDLARIDPASLLAVAALHRTTYSLHLEAGSYVGARHSAQRLRDILDRYASRSRTPEARAAAARQWTRLGLKLLAHGGQHLSPSIACLNEALKHVDSRAKYPPAREAKIRALHARAIVLERIGTPTKALDDLKDLLKIEPNHLEARLREAVTLMHAGRLEDAEPRLRELAALSSPRWIAILAAQQLARLKVDTGQVAEATKILRAGHNRFPHNARLAVLLAYTERPQWQSSTRRVATILKDWPNAEPIRPRARYEGPLEDDEAIRQAIDQDLEQNLDAARAALKTLEADRAR